MAVLWVYADDSTDPGTPERPGQSVFILAGYVGTADVWDALAQEWVTVLNDSYWPTQVSEFKMSDCVGGRNEFDRAKGWTKERRDELVQRLIQVILNPRYIGLTGIGSGHVLEEWEKEPYKRKDLRTLAYTVAFGQLTHIIFSHVEEIDAGQHAKIDGVECVLDEQSNVIGDVDRIYRWAKLDLPENLRDKINRPIFRQSKKTPHLQVADLLAYETFWNLYNWRFQREQGERERLRTLRNGRKHIGSYFGNKEITQLLSQRKSAGGKFGLPDLFQVFDYPTR